MAQFFNILQASVAIVLPNSIANATEAYTSIIRIQHVLLLGRCDLKTR